MKKLAFLLVAFANTLFVSVAFGVDTNKVEQDSRTNPSDSTAISGEWAIVEFLLSDENANKRSEYEDCNGKDSAICEKILDSWRESCARGEEKYCIGAFLIHSDSYIASFTSDTAKQKSGSSITPLKQNCDKGMANSCHAVGEFYNELYLKIRRNNMVSDKELQILDTSLLYFQKSCDLGMAVGCISIANNMFKYGLFQDLKQVKIYTDKARGIADKDCKVGVKMACDYYKEIFED